ncbi:MAG TPA: 50S ribosomal protein L11 methyltransferase [Sulfurovum sp.]|jgi:ribosomal protein L11 methyltransferase|nr:MAG: ribosomal protein L11 methyltransferase [Sulfurovum sp. 35-42-20]OYZ25066.1 MAG: ribosomal protein L11 methyltransferase [Sulfurovum sp. 16-42-52]OYZ48974.1 MAG: ribosomal protein L11 methyltransferase [Sulfurovum sp. 24-42-9]OZA44833.1 MAG: ribosomal protein L11 methyltransferase [Sulfurovum sp. 17-42-90]OZA61114.1 MAG: ribosomal protein L11 methyltransferase [Sulfurovum sp. 39-42-12]HQR73605.1 50S ribosomal protein L11 methyltransferase [Sulfurovum sp.]
MNDKYYELTITLDDTFVDYIADFISNIYDEGLELGIGTIIVRSESDLTYVKDALVSFAQTLEGAITMNYTLQEKENTDWIKTYQESIEPVEAGKFYIFPSWYTPKEGCINIKIDPALAFGSGHHATTFSCLEAISEYVDASKSVIDVGCGSGILGLACKKLGASVELCDTDPLSVESCKENFLLNQEQYDKLWEGSIDKAEHRYDVVIANIIADVLRFIAKDLKNACKEEGLLILSGILDKKENLVTESFKDLTLLKRTLKDEWVTLVYKKETNG